MPTALGEPKSAAAAQKVPERGMSGHALADSSVIRDEAPRRLRTFSLEVTEPGRFHQVGAQASARHNSPSRHDFRVHIPCEEINSKQFTFEHGLVF